MTLRRTVFYIGGATLLAAWFSSAASMSLQRAHRVERPAPPEAASPMRGLVSDVQSQARRMKQRLAAAPVPQQPVRNPFAFHTVEPPARHTGARRDTPMTLPPADRPAEPPLSLIGIAEHTQAQGVVRTAILANHDNLIMAGVGDSILGRYTVAAIDAGVVELSDIETGRTRRLVFEKP